MRLASSIKYGGQLIDAADVDYQAYKHLGLLCPNCKDPVFLQGASERTHKDKVLAIDPHFKHFRVKDPALVKECEARVAKYDFKEIQRRATIARNQRLKTLQRHFWNIYWKANEYSNKIPSNWRNKDYENFCQLISTQSNEFMASIPGMRYLVEHFKTDYNHKENCEICITGFKNKATKELLNVQSAWFKKRLNFLSQVDATMQILIASEVMDFLGAKSSRALLQKIFMFTLLDYVDEPDFRKSIESPQIVETLYGHLLLKVCLIDWTQEFSHVENHA